MDDGGREGVYDVYDAKVYGILRWQYPGDRERMIAGVLVTVHLHASIQRLSISLLGRLHVLQPTKEPHPFFIRIAFTLFRPHLSLPSCSPISPSRQPPSWPPTSCTSVTFMARWYDWHCAVPVLIYSGRVSPKQLIMCTQRTTMLVCA
jgi:hypothetical protein